jgi:hypothetical protein
MMKAPRPQHVAAREKVVILALRWAARSIGTGRIVCFGHQLVGLRQQARQCGGGSVGARSKCHPSANYR